MLPLAHLAHYLWVLYVIPIAIVIVGIAWSQLAARRRDRGRSDSGQGSGESDGGASGE